LAGDVRIVRATLEHAAQLAEQLRREDRAELVATGVANVRTAIEDGVRGSAIAVAVLFDGEVACIAGVVPYPSGTALGGPDTGCVWMLSGTAVNRHKKAFLRLSRSVLKAFLGRYRCLENLVDARYLAAIRWLQWLGFEVSAPSAFGPHEAPFCRAVIRR
jgi:hypothetical protein